MHLPVDISEWFTLSFWILSLLACPMTFIMIFNSGISNKYYKYGMSVVQIVNIVYQTIWAYYYFFNRTPIFNSIQFAASGFVFVSFAFMDIYILQLFKSLNDAISDSAIFTLKLLVLMMFPMCCFWSWIECYLHFFSLYRPPAIDMLSKWGRIIYIVGTVMYDNMQTVFITHVVNNSLKKRSGSKQLNKHMLALNTLLLFMDGLGILVFLIHESQPYESHLYNLTFQLANSFLAFHVSLMILNFIGLLHLKFHKRNGNRFGSYPKRPSIKGDRSLSISEPNRPSQLSRNLKVQFEINTGSNKP